MKGNCEASPEDCKYWHDGGHCLLIRGWTCPARKQSKEEIEEQIPFCEVT